MAANPCWVAKSRILFHSHAGQPKVEKASGIWLGLVSSTLRRLACNSLKNIGASAAEESVCRN